MKKLLLIAFSTFAVSANAWEPQFYLGSNMSSTQFTPTPYFSNFTVTSLDGLAGVILLPHVSVEGRFGIGLGDEQENAKLGGSKQLDSLGVEIEDGDGNPIYDPIRAPMTLKTNYYASVYFRPFISNETATLYGLIGYSTFDYELSLPNGATFDREVELADGSTIPPGSFPAGTVASDGSEGGASFGVGVSFVVTKNVDMTAEWKKIVNADDFSVEGGSVGFTYKF